MPKYSIKDIPALLTRTRQNDDSLTSITLDGNGAESFSTEDIDNLSQIIQNSSFLKSLSIRAITISPENMEKLSTALGQNNTLDKLELQANKLNQESVATLCHNYLSHQPSIKQLRLNDNNFGNNGALQLAEILKKNRTVVAIDLRNCKIGDSGISAINYTLKGNDVLQYCNLMDNKAEKGNSRKIVRQLSSLEQDPSNNITPTSSNKLTPKSSICRVS